MGRSSAFLAFSVVALIAATSPFFFAASAQKTPPKFNPPDITTASDINYPINSVASGAVVVAVSLDGAGMIKGTEVLRDLPSLTAPVLLAIRSWTFKPAILDGNAIDSTIVVSIVFNPIDYRLGGGALPALGKALKGLSPDANGFLPPGIIAPSWAVYPSNTTAQGAVILDAHVSAAGRVARATSVYNHPSLTTTSINAAKNWRFRPAIYRGSPTAANAVVGYVFRLPNISSPVAQP